MSNRRSSIRAVLVMTLSVPLFVGTGLARAGSYDDFFVYIRNDNAAAVAGLIARGFDPNTRDPQGRTGLTIAMQERSAKAARVLLDATGIDIDARSPAGESALMMAALKGDLPATRGLIERGARVDQPGWTALHYAATGPEPKVVAYLLDRGAEVDARSPNDTTPLMMAAQYGTEDSVALLLERGADPKRRNQTGWSVAEFAKASGREALRQRMERLQR